MTLQELREKCGEAMKKLRNLRDQLKAEKDTAKRATLKNDFDATLLEVDDLRNSIDIETRCGPVRRDTLPGRDDFGGKRLEELFGANRDRDAEEGYRFRDTNGREYRALLPHESIVESSRSDDEDEDADNDSPESRMNVGDCLRALVTGQFDSLNDAERRGLLSSTDSGGGFLLNPTLSMNVLDLARSASVCVKAGAQTLPMKTSELNLARLDTDPTAHWRAEGVGVTATSVAFGRIALRPKTLAAIIPVPIELMEDAENMGAILQDALRAAMGLQLDQAALVGMGTGAQPKGVRHHDGINTRTVGGALAVHDRFSQAVGDIMTANFPGEAGELSWIMHPRDETVMDLWKDGEGQPAQLTPWLAKLKRLRTTSLPTTEGAGGNESVSIIGHFRQMLFGTRTTGVVIRVLDSGTVTDSAGDTHVAESELKRLIVAYMRADVALLHPSWFTLIDQIQG